MVTVTDTVSGCSHIAEAMIFQPAVINISDVAVCAGDSVILDAGTDYDSYVWDTGDSTSTITVGTAGDYQISVVDSIGCPSVDTVNVIINALPIVSITSETDTLCTYNETTFDAGAGFAGYDWSTSGTNQTELVMGSQLSLGANTVTVTVTDANGCMAQDSVSIFVDGCAGIEELGFDFTIYPNPSNGMFNVVSEGVFSEAQLTVTNILGQKIVNQSMNNDQNQIDLSSYAEGTYYLTITNGESRSTVILVKQ
jgi:hypothetical protein